MSEKDFLEDLAEVLDMEPHAISNDVALNDENWDSLSVAYTTAIINDHYNLNIDGRSLMSCKSVGALMELIKGRLSSTS